MKLRYFLVALFSLLMLASLCSCRSEKKYKIGVSQCSSDDWRSKMNEEMIREVMLNENAEIEIRSADDSNEKQIEDIRYFADNGFDIIIAAPNEAEPITPVIDEVMDRGIPVVVFDRNVSDDNFTAFQGADNDSIGFIAAEYAKSVFPDGARILEIYGNPGSTPAAGRHKGFNRAFDVDPRYQVAASGIGYWNYDSAFRVADSVFSVNPDIDVVFAHNDRMAIAASDAAANHGIRPFIIGIDAAPEIGIKAVADGKIDATFLYPTEGYSLVRTAMAIITGKPFKANTILAPASAVDKTNADILLMQNDQLAEETSKMLQLKKEVDRYWTIHSIQSTFLYVTLTITILLFIALFFLFRILWLNRRQQKLLVEQNHELERQRDNEKLLNERLNEATQSKLMFFTNVSHVLRTPLTLIAEPVNSVVNAPNLDPQQSTLLRIADKNIKILQRLINQILDFRRYENGRMDLNLTEVDLVRLVGEWTDAFKPVARSRHMKLSLDIAPDVPSHLALDVEKIERVFFNLLSNAFKYTPDNGDIDVKVSFDAASSMLRISVADTGRGISAEDLGNIFGRFFQVDKVHPNGSGIGLSLAKAFVEMHDGSLTAESTLGKGSVFTVTLPVRHIGEVDETVGAGISQADVSAELGVVELPEVKSDVPADPVESAEDGAEPDDSKPLLLVIDDNNDILLLLSQLLGADYSVITASNGADGVKLAARYVPDLVVSDVMMPGMDGYEVCRRIKDEVSTSHIPVLLLTACSLDEQRVEGYDAGADGYLPKPFDGNVLRARCKSLIANRKRIIDLHKDDLPAEVSAPRQKNVKKQESPASNLSALDNDFYNRFLEIFRENIGDADMNVDNLAADLGLGRSQFYRKIKALTNFSPVELIRTLRLKEARHQLLSTEKTVSEIAYGVGFSTPAYFTKCYREAYGETPSDTRNNLTN